MTKLETPRVFVTGAAGFLGAAVLRVLLAEGYAVRALYYPGDRLDHVRDLDVEWVKGDICDEVRMLTLVPGSDALIHIAGLVSFYEQDRVRQYRINVVGTKTLLDTAEQCGVKKFVHVSSVNALGHPAFGEVGDETTSYNWHRHNVGYFKTKKIAQNHALARAKRGLHSVVVCPGTMFGADDVNLNASSYAMGIRKAPPFMVCPPGGTTIADVQAVARGVILALERGRSGETYVLGGKPMLYRDLFRTIAQRLGKKLLVVPLPGMFLLAVGKILDLVSRPLNLRLPLSASMAKGGMHTLFYSSCKAERELGYHTGDPIGALERGIAWLEENAWFEKRSIR